MKPTPIAAAIESVCSAGFEHWVSPCRTVLLVHGDAMKVLNELPRDCVDAVLADPPYSSGGAFRGDRMVSARAKYVSSDANHSIEGFTGDNRDQRSYLAWCSLWMSSLTHIAKDGALIGVFTDWRQLPVTSDAVQAGGWIWRGVAVWQKENARPMLGRYTNQAEYVVWGTNGPRAIEGAVARGWLVCGIDSASDRQHITQKPVEVMKWLIEPVSMGGVVLDPFAGSGTTAVACVQCGRMNISIELNRQHYATAVSRVSDALGMEVLRKDGTVQRKLFAP